MLLTQLIERLPGILPYSDDRDISISRITSDSREVAPGALFVAYHGVGVDGHKFVADAVQRGAAAVVGEEPVEGLPVPYLRVADGRVALAWLNAAWYGHPSRSMTVVGVTGTDGKTTTSNLIFSILRAAGVRAGMISTVNAVIGDETYDTGLHTTTPDSADVQRYLAQMRDAGTEVAVLETTSHGLAQHRVTGIAFDVTVVTNITHEHLDFHGSYEAYRDAKAMLFRFLSDENNPSAPSQRNIRKTAVLNRDDSSFPMLASIPAERIVVYSANPAAPASAQTTQFPALAAATELAATNLRQAPSGMSFDVQRSELGEELEPLQLTTRLVGRFNVSNILAAVGAAMALGIESEAVQAGVAALASIPGRMERIDRGQSFTAIVDFAHTPNALAAALQTAGDLVEGVGRVIAVFGSAGLRDREKRRLMGEVAARFADYTVITAEDPRTESLPDIMAETATAMTAGGRLEGRDFVQVADRQAAIFHAVRNANANDIVLVCGKGHEQSMCFGAVEHAWRDQDALRWALDRLMGAAELQPPFVLPTWEA